MTQTQRIDTGLDVYDMAYAYAMRHGGCTFNTITGAMPTEGYAVALSGFEHVIPLDQFRSVDLLYYDLDHGHPEWLGVWLMENDDEQLVYLDFVVIVEDREEAIALGRDNEQKAIYWIDGDEEIFIQ